MSGCSPSRGIVRVKAQQTSRCESPKRQKSPTLQIPKNFDRTTPNCMLNKLPEYYIPPTGRLFRRDTVQDLHLAVHSGPQCCSNPTVSCHNNDLPSFERLDILIESSWHVRLCDPARHHGSAWNVSWPRLTAPIHTCIIRPGHGNTQRPNKDGELKDLLRLKPFGVHESGTVS